jgi:outer membrane protein OmpA-like peptidoglycan-associated protein
MNSPPAPAYTVFFTHASAELDAPAREVIRQAAAASRAAPDARVTVIGWTDSAGSPAADVALSRRRADRVAERLVMDGVAPARLVRQARGQTGEDPGVASRRVEIDVGG